MDKDLFSGLDDLGFKDIEDVDLFKKTEEEEKPETAAILNDEEREKSLLYDREIICPACSRKITIKALKKSSNKVLNRESDFYVSYNLINPYFYEVFLCNRCGYAALSSDFLKLKPGQAELVRQKVTPKWQGKVYPEVFDVNIAIERYKLALLNYFYTDDVASKKAMTCLRIGWMYRLLHDTTNEKLFLKQALEGFEHAYSDEKFPFYDMDEFTVQYLIGELYRRIGDEDKAMSWYGKVITSIGARQKIKEKARDQRDLIYLERKRAERERAEVASTVSEDAVQESEVENEHEKKGGFFSKFFNK